jgi:hypothetical protein
LFFYAIVPGIVIVFNELYFRNPASRDAGAKATTLSIYRFINLSPTAAKSLLLVSDLQTTI